MKYEIKGGSLPVVICTLTPNMKMETSSNGGVSKALGRMFTGESIFQNIYTAENGPGMIAFASSFPGSIIPFEINNVRYAIPFFRQKKFFAPDEENGVIEINGGTIEIEASDDGINASQKSTFAPARQRP